MHIRRLQPTDAETFQALRLQALQESPTAFGSSYEEEVDRPLGAIASSLTLTDGPENAGRNMFGAYVGSRLVGIVGVGREAGIKESHRGFIRSMYVEPGFRGQGLGKALLAEALQFALSMPGLRQITLAVTSGNLAAANLYEQFGFAVFGTAPQALQVDGRFYDELQMVHHLGQEQKPMAAITNNLAVLAVHDIDLSRAFYIEKLGFEEYLRTGGWSFLRRGSLFLRIGHCPGVTPISELGDHSLIVQAVVDDAQALYAELKQRGAEPSAPEDKDWGQREFGVVSPDGHRMLFSQKL